MELVNASAVTPRQMPMLWRDRIPAATLSVIAGRPGVGKSTLESLIAAELSRRGIAGIVSNSEDDVESVQRPRLEAAGADLSLVSLVPSDDELVFPRDFDLLESLIRERDARYVIFDPIEAHFRPERRVHDRQTLMTLVRIARSTRCAVIAIHHQTKTGSGDGGDPLSRIGGPSGGLAGTSRAAFLYGYDPEDVDQRALVCVKINGVEKPPAVIFEHEVHEYDSHGVSVEAGVLRVVGESNADGRDTYKPGRAIKARDAEVDGWLSTFLAAGADCKRQTSEVRSAAKAEGYRWQTVLRSRVSIKAQRERFGFGGDGFWMWRLPDEHPLRGTPEPEPAVEEPVDG